MNEKYLRGLFEHLGGQEKLGGTYEDWSSSIKDDEDYKKGLFKHLGGQEALGGAYQDWNNDVFLGGQQPVTEEEPVEDIEELKEKATYKFGDQNIKREEAIDLIKDAEEISEVEGLAISDDPTLQRMLEDRFGEPTEVEQPVEPTEEEDEIDIDSLTRKERRQLKRKEKAEEKIEEAQKYREKALELGERTILYSPRQLDLKLNLAEEGVFKAGRDEFIAREGNKKYGFDTEIKNIKQESPSIPDDKAAALVLNKKARYITENVFNKREKEAYKAMKAIEKTNDELNRINRRLEHDPANEKLIERKVQLREQKVEFEQNLEESRKDGYKQLYDTEGNFLDTEWTDQDNEEVTKLSQSYSKWNIEALQDIMYEEVAKYQYLKDLHREVVEDTPTTETPRPSPETGFDPAAAAKYRDVARKRQNITEVAKEQYKTVKAISRALLLNTDPASVKRTYGKAFARGLVAGYLPTETEITERYVETVQKHGGQITVAQEEAATPKKGEEIVQMFGTTTEAMGELMLTTFGTKGVAGATGLSKSIKAIRLGLKAKKGRTALALFDSGMAMANGAIRYGLTPNEEISGAMGVGEELAQHVLSGVFRTNAVGKILRPFIRTLTGGSSEMVAEYTGEMVNALKDNGWDVDDAYNRAFGSTKDERLKRLGHTAILCYFMSAGGQISKAAARGMLGDISDQMDNETHKGVVDEMIEELGDVEGKPVSEGLTTPKTKPLTEQERISFEPENMVIKNIVTTEKILKELDDAEQQIEEQESGTERAKKISSIEKEIQTLDNRLTQEERKADKGEPVDTKDIKKDISRLEKELADTRANEGVALGKGYKADIAQTLGYVPKKVKSKKAINKIRQEVLEKKTAFQAEIDQRAEAEPTGVFRVGGKSYTTREELFSDLDRVEATEGATVEALSDASNEEAQQAINEYIEIRNDELRLEQEKESKIKSEEEAKRLEEEILQLEKEKDEATTPERSRVKRQILETQSGVTEQEADAALSIFDAQARVFAETTGQTTEDYYSTLDVLGEEAISPEARQAREKGATVRGEIEFKDGRHIVKLFKNANISTLLHEVAGHRGRRLLSQLATTDKSWAKRLSEVEKWAGAKDGKWNRKAEEKFAKAFEQYMKDGVLPKNAPVSLKEVFDKLAQWMKEIYSSPAVLENLSPEVTETFDALLGAKDVTGISEVTEETEGIKPSEDAPSSLFQTDERFGEVTVPVHPDVINGFYSPIEKRIIEFKQNKVSVAKWKKIIGTKDEARFTGITEWLDGMNPEKTIAKEEVLGFLKDNRIVIEEVVRADDNMHELRAQAGERISTLEYNNRQVLRKVEEALRGTGLTIREVIDIIDVAVSEKYTTKYTKDYVDGMLAEAEVVPLISEMREMEKSIRNLKDEYEYLFSESEARPSWVSEEFNTAGKRTNYKEVVVTLPTRVKKYNLVESTTGAVLASSDNKSELNKELQRRRAPNTEVVRNPDWDNNVFKEKMHYPDIANVLVSIRLDERIDADGKKVVFLEEVQSDWGQRARQVGYKGESSDVAGIQKRIEEIEANQLEHKSHPTVVKYFEKYNYYSIDNNFVSKLFNSKNEEEIWLAVELDNNISKLRLLDQQLTKAKKLGVPKAPFISSTGAWTKLGLKTLLKQAIGVGAERISWATGEQQSARYATALQRTIAHVNITTNRDHILKDNAVKGLSFTSFLEEQDGFYVEVDSDGMIVHELNMDQLGSHIGRHLSELATSHYADAIMGFSVGTVLNTNGLVVSSKGMKSFYGSKIGGSGIVGKVAQGLFKQEPTKTFIYTNQKNLDTPVETFSVWVDSNYEELGLKNPKEIATLSEERKQEIENKYNEYAYDKEIVFSVDVTPDMENMTEEGMPLFQTDDVEAMRNNLLDRVIADVRKSNPNLSGTLLRARVKKEFINTVGVKKEAVTAWLNNNQKFNSLSKVKPKVKEAEAREAPLPKTERERAIESAKRKLRVWNFEQERQKREKELADRIQTKAEEQRISKFEAKKAELKRKHEEKLLELERKPILENPKLLTTKQLKGKKVSMDVEVEETGEKKTVEMSALKAHTSIKKRFAELSKIIDCVG